MVPEKDHLVTFLKSKIMFETQAKTFKHQKLEKHA